MISASSLDEPLQVRHAAFSRRFLRRATRAEHRAVEQTAVMLALFEQRLGHAAYIRLLQGHYAFYADWERRHASWISDGLRHARWQYQSRLPAIASDLHGLAAAATLPVEDAMASIQANASAPPAAENVSWGSLYVIEGSALGGQIVARKLLQEFPDHPHAFFHLSHGGDRPGWKFFQSLMAEQLGDAPSRRTITLQARATFGAFRRMLDAVMP